MVHDDRNSAYGALDRYGPIRDNDPVCRGIVGNAYPQSELIVFARAFERIRYISCF